MSAGSIAAIGRRHSCAKPIQLARMKKSLLFLLCLPLLARAEWGGIEQDFEQDKPWQEVVAQLPPYPKAENLVSFVVSPASRHQYFIDVASVSVGGDGVVRYTVVIESAGGAKNVSFEGVRCGSGERRLYAYGHPDSTWSKARNAGWEGIQFFTQNSYQRVLYVDYFCPDGLRVKDSEEAVRNLRQAAP
jgi:hypothetical protein